MRREKRLGMPGGFVEGTTRRVVVIVKPLGRIEPRESTALGLHVQVKVGPEVEPASISDGTIQMDHNAVVLFTIDRLARSQRATVRTRGTELAPDRWIIK